MQFHLQQQQHRTIDLVHRNLSTLNCLLEAGQHRFRLAQSSRPQYQVDSRQHGQHGCLRQRIGVADAAHPEGIADDDALKVQLVAQ